MLSRRSRRVSPLFRRMVPGRGLRGPGKGARDPDMGAGQGGARRCGGHVAGRLATAAAGLLLGVIPALADCGGGRDLLAELKREDPAAWARVMQAAEAEPYSEGLFWKLTPPGGAPSFLLGSYHFPHPLIDPAPEGPSAALDDARLMLMETLPEESARLMSLIAADPSMIANLDRPPLDQVLPAEDFQAVAEALTIHGMTPERIARMRPWFLSLLLMTPPCAMEAASGPEGTMDGGFAARAARQGIPVRGMETWDNLLPLLQEDEWSEASLDGLVMAARDLARARDQQTTGARLYAAQTVWPIWTLSIHQAEEAGAAFDAPRIRDRLFDERNEGFVETALPQLREGGVFMVVGALHLGGEKGVLRLLEAQGFSVSRLPLDRAPK